MCGLSGALLHAPSLGADEFLRRLARMSGTLRHRGPDHEAGWSDGVIGLGHNRLSIIDRSAAAHQPLADATGRIRIVTNGEIYNFRELREELEGRGRRFLTRSDTEVVAAGYECWALELVPTEHTPKNLMLRAMNRHAPDPSARAEYEALRVTTGGAGIGLARRLR